MIQNIQALRFLAALAVLLYHVSSIYNHYNGQAFAYFTKALDPFGRVGVDIFFVISGVVIWLSTNKAHGREDAAPFVLHRYARIFITYWPMLIFAVLVDIIFRNYQVDKYGIIRSITLLPDEFGFTGKLILPVSWTLTYELIFYTTFAVLMLLSRYVALGVMTLWGAFCLTTMTPGGTFFSPHIAEFAAGCLIGAAMPFIQRARLPAILLSFAAVCLFIQGAHGSGTWSRVVWFGSFSVIVIVLAIWLEARGLKAGSWYSTLGGMSFSLYLCHFPILQAFSHQWQAVKAHPEAMLLPVIPLSLAFAWVWYRYAEIHLNRVLRNAISNFFARKKSGACPPIMPISQS